MNKKTIAINKPNQTTKMTNRFDQAATFATNTTAPHETTTPTVSTLKPELKDKVVNTDTYTVVFNAPLEIKHHIRIFIALPTCPFKDKSEFITQCINDGFDKYKNINQETTMTTKDKEKYKEIFKAPIQMKKDLKVFMFEKTLFKYKKDFLVQCVIDGLKKYGGIVMDENMLIEVTL